MSHAISDVSCECFLRKDRKSKFRCEIRLLSTTLAFRVNLYHFVDTCCVFHDSFNIHLHECYCLILLHGKVIYFHFQVTSSITYTNSCGSSLQLVCGMILTSFRNSDHLIVLALAYFETELSEEEKRCSLWFYLWTRMHFEWTENDLKREMHSRLEGTIPNRLRELIFLLFRSI